MDALCYRIATMVPRLITLLLVGWYWIMNQCLNTIISKILLQFVTLFAENGELVIDIVLIIDTFGERD
jgi:hypothetical protein